MSQNQPQSPKSRKSQVRPAKKGVLKRFTLQALRGMIDQLEGVVQKLEVEPADSPRKKSGYWRRRLSRLILGGAIATIAVLVICLIPGLVFGNESLPQLSENPPIMESLPQPEEEVVIEESTVPEEILIESEEEEEIMIEEAILPEEIVIEPEESIVPEETLIESELEAEADKLPLVLAATEPPQTVKFVQPPSLERSPQEDLIAKIQNKITQATDQLGLDKIILSIEPHFSAGLLTIKVSDDWYKLTEPQQNEFAQLLLNKTQTLDFTRLKLYNGQGKEIARNAIIGTDMIILDRIQS